MFNRDRLNYGSQKESYYPANESAQAVVNCHRKALVHFIANCTVCDWKIQDYQTGQKKAAAHARKTGHRVIADLGYTCSYGG